MSVFIIARRAALLALFFWSAGAAGAVAAETWRYSVVAHGEKVGALEAVVKGDAADIDYIVRDNGRGPKIREHVEWAGNGGVLSWTVKGESAFGSQIDETYSWKDGEAVWRSQADQGSVRAGEPAVYVANDASPWALGLYARALLKTKTRKISVLPGGYLALEDLGEEKLGEGGKALRVRVYALSGVDLLPDFVMIDKKGRFVAQLGKGSVTVLADYEDQYDRLVGLFSKLTERRVEALQAKLAHKYRRPIRYRNVRILNPSTGKLSEPATVVVFGDKISSIDLRNPPADPKLDEVVVDGEGGVLMPGLHDMHSHTTPWTGLFYLAAGVTATRDQGNDNETLLDIIKKTEEGRMAGPRIVHNGLIEGRSPYSVRTGVIASTLDEAVNAVRWYADHDYFQIKLYSSVKPEWVKPLATEAHRLGLKVTGHVPAFMTADEAILAGYDDIAHVNQLMLGWLLKKDEDTRTPLRLTGMARAADLDLNSPKVRRTVELMKQHHVALDTTAMILERLMLSRAGEVQEGDKPYLDHMPIGYQRYRKRSFVSLSEPGADERYEKAFRTLLGVLRLLHENGVQLLPGTDDGTGVSLHRELEVYAKAGIPNADILRLDTIAAERYFNRDQSLGSIEKGKYADFILLDGDPLKDISAVRRVRLVSRGGVIYFPSEIYEALSIKPFAPPPPLSISGPAGAP